MSYKVTLNRSFTGERRRRAGIEVTRTEPFVGELSDEQLGAIKGDAELVLTGVEREVQDTKATARTTKKVTKKA